MESNSKIFVAGHRGLVGSAIVRNLKAKGFNNIITEDHSKLDLTNEVDTYSFFVKEKPEYVFDAAAKVGGIMSNKKYPADFIHDNLRIQINIIHNSYRAGVKKLIFLGSSCIYPKLALQPIKENSLLDGKLEPTNDAYAIAKIAGIRMCKAYKQQYGFNAISLMPTNLYGINDNFDLENSHVVPAMIRKFHEADSQVILWGDGSPKREFLHVDDLAEACFICMQNYDEIEHINIGTGYDISIKKLAAIISKVVGNKKIKWDISKPNGTARKVLNVDKIKALGWKPVINIEDGIRSTYKWYCNQLRDHI
tara:strand:- start:129 stop:1052 length:924 start_codon:yes stop_codon:yes gene_type:complete